MAVTFKLEYKSVDNFYTGENPRQDVYKNISLLDNNIRKEGLTNPIVSWLNPEINGKANLEICQGHRRMTVIKDIAKDKKLFKKLFPKGIPTIVWQGMSQVEAQKLKIDSVTTEELTSEFEAYVSAEILFLNGATEAEVANTLTSTLQKCSKSGGMNKDTKKKIVDLEQELLLAKQANNIKHIRDIEKEIYQIYALYHRGHVQALKAVFDCPILVRACKQYQSTGIKPKGFETLDLISLTNNDVKTLLKAHKRDLEVKDDNNLPKYNKINHGKLFQAEYDKLVAEKNTPKSEKPKAKHSMSYKDIVSLAETYNSKGIKTVCLKCANEEVSGSHAYDNLYVIADLIMEHDDALWKKCEKSAKEILKRLSENK